MSDGPLIVQSDKTVLLEVDHELAGAARAAIAPFAELERAPNTCTPTASRPWRCGMRAPRPRRRTGRRRVGQFLPLRGAAAAAGRHRRHHGPLRPSAAGQNPAHGLTLVSLDRAVLEEVLRHKKIAPMLGAGSTTTPSSSTPVSVAGSSRCCSKSVGPLRISRDTSMRGTSDHAERRRWQLRDYQQLATDSFWPVALGWWYFRAGPQDPGRRGSNGQSQCDDADPGYQHRRRPAMEARAHRPYFADDEEIANTPANARKSAPSPFRRIRWLPSHQGRVPPSGAVRQPRLGLIVYDEVHLLPAPVFRMTADLQSKRRLGLTATLIREDGREGDVFSLIGPNAMTRHGRTSRPGLDRPGGVHRSPVTMTDNERMMYATAEPEERYKLCSTVHTKIAVVKSILAKHPGEQTLVIGAYLDQLDELGEELNAPSSRVHRTKEREALFDAFRRGELSILVVSKVANFSIDLPKPQSRTGFRNIRLTPGGGATARRLLRPKADGGGAVFYSVVARDSLDAEYAAHRQRFLAEQGYGYIIRDADDLLGPAI